MFNSKINFEISSRTAILLLALTQIPTAITYSLEVGCILSTKSDYSVFWKWSDVPLYKRVRYCNGSSIKSLPLKQDVLSSQY